ncbi:hypothetical protein DFJ43DRAFT_1037036 [Lentinula guzmanii]|uniref:Asteroid domain-containing protein n=1 Tax=Lentinula guzmanii TaxID=2804957 RepID=A0AA38N2V1_9AGAR|nr:hypothetical protein DFJ43DRAFT_1037036 [Lentinula guzmanii]
METVAARSATYPLLFEAWGIEDTPGLEQEGIPPEQEGDEEGDPYAVELAGRLGAYVVANDSDFAILNTEGYRGFIPLQSMVWHALVDEEMTHEEYDDPEALSSFLEIPITLLPLLGALAGNDFSNQSAGAGKQVQQIFSSNVWYPVHASIAFQLRYGRFYPSLQKSTGKQAKYHVDSVMDLISKTVKALLIRSLDSLGSGEVEEIVERVVDSTLQNIAANEWTQDGTQEEDLVPSAEFVKLDAVRNTLMQAYRAGQLSPNILNCLNSGSLWPRLFLENPDAETTAKMTRPIRMWYCAILDDAVGLPEIVDEVMEESEQVSDDLEVVSGKDDEAEEELVDVVESGSEDEGPDMLAPLKGALRRLHDPNSGPTGPPSADATLPVSVKQSRVTEYYRRGTRVVDETVQIPSLSELLSEISKSELLHTSAPHTHHYVKIPSQPLLTRTPDVRLAVFYRALSESDDTLRKTKSLTPEQLLTALALRWLLRFLRDKAAENPQSKERQQERWTEKEARCLLSAFDWNVSGHANGSDPSYEVYQGYPPILNRNVQLTSQILQCLDSVHQLAEWTHSPTDWMMCSFKSGLAGRRKS